MKTILIIILLGIIVYLLIKDKDKIGFYTYLDNLVLKLHNFLKRRIDKCQK